MLTCESQTPQNVHMEAMSIRNLSEIPYTSIEHVPALLAERRRDQSLIKKVISALDGDIPDYLLEHDCLVLSRHISTPNSEALYALEQAKKLGFMMIFSQDLDDQFTSVNNLKRRLALRWCRFSGQDAKLIPT